MHNIDGKRFVGAREAGWHSIGKVIPEGIKISVEEAIRIGDIDFQYLAVPMGYELPGGTFVNSGEKQVILRAPRTPEEGWEELGVTGTNYTFLQNLDLARGLDAIAKETGWEFETVGSLGKGETVFMTLRTGKQSIFGDDIDTYLVLSDGKCAQRALQIAIALIRVVCQNTLMASDNSALVKVTIDHDQHVASEFQFWLDLIVQLQKAQDTTVDELKRMAEAKISDKEAKVIIEQAMPALGKTAKQRNVDTLAKLANIPVDIVNAAAEKAAKGTANYAQRNDLIVARRDFAFTQYQRFNAGQEQGLQVAEGGKLVDPETFKQLAETPYAVLQAVTELVDWGGSASAEAAAENALFGRGSEIKQRAWKAALKMADKKLPNLVTA